MDSRPSPSVVYLDTLRAALDAHADAAFDSDELAARMDALEGAVDDIEKAVAARLEADSEAKPTPAQPREPLLMDPLTRRLIDPHATELPRWARGLLFLGAGLRAGHSAKAGVPKSTPEFVRTVGDAAAQLAAARRVCRTELRAVEDGAHVRLGVPFDPRQRFYLLVRDAADEFAGIEELDPEAADVEEGISRRLGGAGELEEWRKSRRGLLVPFVCGVWVREQLVATLELLDEIGEKLARLQARSEALVETERHADGLVRQREADEAADAREVAENKRRDREGVLATAGVVLIAPGLVASVYGANVLDRNGSSLGFGLLMLLAVVAGFLAVRLVSHNGRAPSSEEIAAVAPLTYAAPFLAAASWDLLADLKDWETVAVTALCGLVLAAGVARLETGPRH